MNRCHNGPSWLAAPTLLVVAVWATDAVAQSSSMFGNPDERGPLTLERNSWTYRPPQPVKKIKLNDLVTVMVDEKSFGFLTLLNVGINSRVRRMARQNPELIPNETDQHPQYRGGSLFEEKEENR